MAASVWDWQKPAVTDFGSGAGPVTMHFASPASKDVGPNQAKVVCDAGKEPEIHRLPESCKGDDRAEQGRATPENGTGGVFQAERQTWARGSQPGSVQARTDQRRWQGPV